MKKRLFVLSVDSLFYDDTEWLKDCPNLYGIYKHSAVVKRIKSTFPAMTYVAHSTMMTGCYPDTHGICHNKMLKAGDDHPPWNWYRRQLQTNTVFDAAREKGYAISVVNWPVTGGDPNIDYLVPEIWTDGPDGDVRPRFLSACSEPVIQLFDRYRHLLNWDCLPELDNFGVACLKDIIRDHRPELVMLHLSYLDHNRHVYGAFSPEAKQALLECDRKIGEIFDIMDGQGTLGETDFFVMGDHGHLPVKQVFHPNILLVKEGLIDLNGDGTLGDCRCFIHSAGLSAYVTLMDPEDTQVRRRVETILEQWVRQETYGCRRVLNKEQLADLHLAGPMDYAIEGSPGTSFGNNCTGELIQPVGVPGCGLSVSGHGHLPDNGPQPIFFGAGPDIKEGVTVERGELIDEAPTYAAILGLEMPWAQGKPISEILKPNMAQKEEQRDSKRKI